MMESKPQMKHFSAVALDCPQNRMGQTHLAYTLTMALLKISYSANEMLIYLWILHFNSIGHILT